MDFCNVCNKPRKIKRRSCQHVFTVKPNCSNENDLYTLQEVKKNRLFIFYYPDTLSFLRNYDNLIREVIFIIMSSTTWALWVTLKLTTQNSQSRRWDRHRSRRTSGSYRDCRSPGVLRKVISGTNVARAVTKCNYQRSVKSFKLISN